ncbi:MAG: hypothetical protein ED556_09225 [Winogradskyella sp.]|uniref:hypothetical protein n=1 Tax=Winogradskyella sp. TaxID=1883156 RepID=UPI000F41EE5F|nr:hypothetical protein [Winogradskyella sp.]RNC86457.1 MAG: hypothetical protein ED556_09225 [Winogradskyella sp.]
MSIDLCKLVFDTGTLVLIWLVQLVIYPSFLFYSEEDLKHWHIKYTKRISVVVLPLMLAQLIFSGFQVYIAQNLYTIVNLALLIVIWAITFGVFVPIHNGISKNSATKIELVKLVNYNWYRTLLWTIVFALSFFNFISN